MSTSTAPQPPDTRPTRPGEVDTATAPPWPRRVLIGLPLLVIAAVAVTEPAVIRATVGSAQALLIVAGIGALALGWSALLRRFLSNEWAITGLILAPLALVGVVWVLPYYGADQVVDEALPGGSATVAAALPATAPASVGPAAAPADEQANQGPPTDATDADAQAATDGTDGNTQLGDATQPGAATPQEAAEQPQSAVDAPAEPAPAVDAPAEPAPAEPAPPAGPVEVSRGTFTGLDGHYANGDAAVYRLEDGSHIVRLDEVDLQRVPEPFVYLVPGGAQTGLAAGAVNLGPLAGNVGSSNYTIPAEIDLAGEFTVLVWCEPFASPVGGATQVAGQG